MERTYFKRLDYHKEDIAGKVFENMVLETGDNTQVTLLPVGEIEKYESPDRLNTVFDFTKTFREKNCGLGDNYVNEVKNKRNSGFYLQFDRHYKSEKTVLIRFTMDAKNDVLYDQSFISVPDGVHAQVVIYYDSEETSCFRNGLLSIDLGKEAELKLVKVQNLASTSKNFETMKVSTHFKSKFEAYLVELGSEKTGTTCSVYMPEEWAEIEMYPLYFIDGIRNMDLEQNLVINGKNSLGIINAKGVLKDEAKKMFRGNVFLNRGCKRSIGRFSDSDIMLSEKARALSIPTILCDEDDVMGEHAASFEAINKEKMYYLMSRGFDEIAAKKLIVESAFKPVFKLIEDEEIREHLIAQLNSKL